MKSEKLIAKDKKAAEKMLRESRGLRQHDYPAGQKVYARNGEEYGGKTFGKTTGHTRTCSCGGTRLRTLWADGTYTYPCVKGMVWSRKLKAWKIQ